MNLIDRFRRQPAPSQAPIANPREWLEISTWGRADSIRNNGTVPTGWIPRDVVEAMDIDCSPMDRRDDRGRQGTIWYTAEQGAAIRAHPEFESIEMMVERSDSNG